MDIRYFFRVIASKGQKAHNEKSWLASLGLTLFGCTLFFSMPIEANSVETDSKNQKNVSEITVPAIKPSKLGKPFFNAQSFTLKNGLTVYLVENHRTPVAGITVVYRVGSSDDPRGKAGLAHFVEHMMFKGPKGSSHEKVMRDAESVGGSVNAVTSYDWTKYYEIVPKEYFESFVKLESDRMRMIPARQEDVTPEIQVVLEEESRSLGNNPILQFIGAMEAAFFRHHPYGTLPIGYRSEIKAFSPEDVKAFHQAHYGPNNAFIMLSGDLTLDEAKSLMEKYFADIPRRGGWNDHNRNRVSEPPLNYNVIVEKSSDRVNTPYVRIQLPGFQAFPNHLDDADALDAAIYALVNPTSGLLYLELVEKQKVATFFSIQFNSDRVNADSISIMTQAAENVSKEQLLDAFKTALERVVETGITQKQLDQIKKEILVSGDYIKDSLLSGSDHLITPIIGGHDLKRYEHWHAYLDALTVDHVNAALKKYLSISNYVLGYLVPDETKPKTNQPISPAMMSADTNPHSR